MCALCGVLGGKGHWSDSAAAPAVFANRTEPQTRGRERQARTRLHAFVRNPTKHAWHAVKVLVKFKLLEAQTISIEEWKSWVQQTPYIETIRGRFFPTSSLDDLTLEALAALVKIGAASASTEHIQNR